MNVSGRRRGIIVAGALIFFLQAGCSNNGAAKKNGAVIVNGEVISRTQIEYLAEYVAQATSAGNPSAVFAGRSPRIKQQAAQQLVANHLLLQEAKHRDISFDTAQPAKAFAAIRDRFGDEAAFKRYLTASGQTEKSLRDQIEDGMVLDTFVKVVLGGMDTVSEKECRTYYEEHPGHFQKNQKANARQILFLHRADTAAQQKKKEYEKAAAVLAELKAGGDFKTLAQKHSEGPDASNGGEIGWFKKGEMLPEIEKAVFALPKGGISDVVETQIGYHIFQKTDEGFTEKIPFEKAREQIALNLEIRNKNKVIGTLVDSLWQAADITWLDSTYVPVAP